MFARALAALILLTLATAVPNATATAIESTVFLHDLTREGAYVGCHVTSPAFTTFRLTVKRGDEVTLAVRAPENNTNVHTLAIQPFGVKTQPLQAGQSAATKFTAGATGSHPVLCDESPGSLQGLVIVRESDAATKESPGMGLLAVAAGAIVAIFALRGRRR